MSDRQTAGYDVLLNAIAVTFCRHHHWIARTVERGVGGSDDDLRACDVCLSTAAKALASVYVFPPGTGDSDA
jgi:hypothetical protein